MSDPIVERWIAQCVAQPGELPSDFEPVQTRLIRAVGRAEHPQLGVVYAKVMGFPRFRDRVRYVHRDLPAVHEAEMLRRVSRAGIAAPAVVAVHAVRRFGLPAASVLITRGLDGETSASFDAALGVAVRLADAGVFHPDLNRGNFISLRDGGTAILDLQSARASDGRVSPARRRRMAAKLVMEFGADADLAALAHVGLVDQADLSAVAEASADLVRVAFERRVRRCLTTSTEFVVERGLTGTLHRRRSHSLDVGACVPHDLARELWIGDRVCELQAGSEPVLAGMFQKAWWFPGRNSAKIATSDGRKLSAVDERRLHEAFMRLPDAGSTTAASSED